MTHTEQYAIHCESVEVWLNCKSFDDNPYERGTEPYDIWYAAMAAAISEEETH